jgi:hypothetical protein
MGSTKTKTTTVQNTTPTVTQPYSGAFQDYTGLIGDFLDMDPTQFVAPPSDLQTQAFSDANNLGGWQPYLSQAGSLAGSVAAAPTTQVTATGYQAPTAGDPSLLSGAQLAPASTYGGTTLGSPTQTQSAQVGSATGYTAPQIGSVAGPTATAAQQTSIGSAPTVSLSGYNLPQLGQASQVGTYGYNAPQLGDAALSSSEGLLGDASRLKDFMGDYQNPYTQQVIDATLADFDEYAGTQRAAQDAQAGLTGAFGGSRYGIMEGQLEGELARGRASTQAALLDQQYRLAAELGGQDMNAANQFALTNAGMGLQTNLANQSAQNMYGLEQAGLSERAGQYNASNALQSGLANQDASNQFALSQYGAGIDAARYGADASNQSQLVNQDAAAQFSMAQFGADTQRASQFADALNVASQMGFQGDIQTALAQAGFDADAAQYFASMVNQFQMQQGSFDQQTNLANQDAVNNFMLQQGLFDQQTGQLNTDAMNQFALQQGLLDQQTGTLNMEATNNFLMTQLGLDADAARYYADALNQASFQNADLTEQSYLRDLQAAGLYGDLSQQYSTQSLADLGMTADLGTLQRSLEAEYLNAYPTQLQLAGNLYSQLSPTIYSGAAMTGTNTSKTGGTGTWLPQLAGSAMQAGAVAFSDRRLKSNIAKVGELEDGLGVYDYDIAGKRERGVMADEVAQLRPWALGPTVAGFATVDYGKLENMDV